MGGMGLPAVGLSRASPRSDEPPSVVQSRIAGKQKTPHKGAFLCLVVMGGIEPTQSVVMRQTPDWLYRIRGSLEEEPNCQSVGEADPPIEGTIGHNSTHSANGEGVPLGTPSLFGGDGWN